MGQRFMGAVCSSRSASLAVLVFIEPFSIVNANFTAHLKPHILRSQCQIRRKNVTRGRDQTRKRQQRRQQTRPISHETSLKMWVM